MHRRILVRPDNGGEGAAVIGTALSGDRASLHAVLEQLEILPMPTQAGLWSQDASRASISERYSHGGTTHTIFTWWARRPHAGIQRIVAAALRDVTTPDGCAPRLLDLFAGGATIPFEAARLGAQAVAVESNALAHFIQAAILTESQRVDDLADLVRRYGELLLNELALSTDDLYPARRGKGSERTIAYFWSRGLRCPGCTASLSLQKRPWLSKKADRQIGVIRRPDPATKSFSRSLSFDVDEISRTTNAWERNEIRCPFCGYHIRREEIAATLKTHGFDELTAACISPRRGKRYVACPDERTWVPSAPDLARAVELDHQWLGGEFPSVPLPKWSGIVNPPLYGIEQVHDLLSPRQLAVMLRLCRSIRNTFEACAREHGEATARAVIGFLSAFVDQLADWNSRLCMWIAQNEQVGRALSGPGIPMMWDFVETDPLQHGPANLWTKLDRIATGVASIPRFLHKPTVVHGDARTLPLSDESVDVVVTDPPYYDNLYYTVLADCIYPWKRLALEPYFPKVFSNARTDGEVEISASKHRQGSVADADTFYTRSMTEVLAEARRVLRPEGKVFLLYSHSSIEGWASIYNAFFDAWLELVDVRPTSMERKHRPRGMRSRSVECSFILVAKKRSRPSSGTEWNDLTSRLETELGDLDPEGPPTGAPGEWAFATALRLVSSAAPTVERGRTLSGHEIVSRIVDMTRGMPGGLDLVTRR